MIIKDRTFEDPYATKKFATVLGHKMAYIDEGEGTPIIFQHGDPASSYLWRNVMPHLEGRGRLIAPDLMGFGDSEKLPVVMGRDRYTFPEQAKYFEALMGQLVGNEKVILVVHDCGGFVGLNWANHHRNQILAIAYMEALVAPLELDDFPKFAQDAMKNATPEFYDSLLASPPMLFDNLVYKAKQMTDKEKDNWYRPFKKAGEDRRPTVSLEMPIKGIASDKVYNMVAEYSEWMGANTLPKLFIHATPGYLIKDRTYDICRHWKNQTQKEVKGEHYIQESTPDEVGEYIREFVEEVVK